jgi:ATP-binding cassette, subfamily B, bacterial PglK
MRRHRTRERAAIRTHTRAPVPAPSPTCAPMSLLVELWSVLTPPQRRRVIGAQVISVAMALSTVTGIAAIAPFFAVLGDPRLIDQNRLLHWLYAAAGFSSGHAFAVALGFGFIGVVLLANLINAIGGVAMNRLALRIGAELQATLFGEYLRRPYTFHATTHSTTLFNNIVHETARVTNGILQSALALVTNLIASACVVLSVLLLNTAVSLTMLMGLAGGYAVIYLCARSRLLRLGQGQSRAWSEQTKIVNESLGAIREILLLRDSRLFYETFAGASRDVADFGVHVHTAAQIPKHVMECVAVAALVSAALVAGTRSGGMGPWLGQLTFMAFAAYRLLPMLQQIFAAAVRIRADRAALTLVAPDLRPGLAVTSASTGHPKSAGHAWRHRPREDVRLKDVSFQYGMDRAHALVEVNLRVPARSMVGIVGANGSGKTTLMDLIAGLLTPTSGEVLIDGAALDEDSRSAWQSRIAYVPQNIFLLDSSIAQNIAFGIAQNQIDVRRMIQAARAAQLEDFVASLPHRYDQKVGERGIQLSGGQRQRIGIARALYKEAPVLLLDEAMSALDGMTGAELVSVLETLRGRSTIILIAHRLSLVRGCDVIFQLESGRIIGSGRYEELTRKSASFRRMIGVGST